MIEEGKPSGGQMDAHPPSPPPRYTTNLDVEILVLKSATLDSYTYLLSVSCRREFWVFVLLWDPICPEGSAVSRLHPALLPVQHSLLGYCATRPDPTTLLQGVPVNRPASGQALWPSGA